jgi:hypothetical protein
MFQNITSSLVTIASFHIPANYLLTNLTTIFLQAELPRYSSTPGRGRKLFSRVKHPGRLRDSVGLLCYECYRVLPREKGGLGVRQTVHLHLMSSLGMNGTISTLAPAPSRRAQG